jgi:uncharacterized surface protein with fasciclin (FAS1) repeats
MAHEYSARKSTNEYQSELIGSTNSRSNFPFSAARRIQRSLLMFAFKSLVTGLAIAGATLAVQAKDIVDTAVAAGNFKTLATALQAAGLVETLKGKGPFTVFAPTDEAFAKVPKDQLDALLKDKAALTKVLTYHVVPGKVMAKDVKAGKVKTVQGSELTVATTGGVMVDGAKVTATDIVADNGVIHVIDSVVMPK